MNKITSEVGYLPRMVKVHQEQGKEPVESEWCYKLHKCVENIEVTPKLKLESQSWSLLIGYIVEWHLQEFQYGDNVFQTTTNNDSTQKRIKKC